MDNKIYLIDSEKINIECDLDKLPDMRSFVRTFCSKIHHSALNEKFIHKIELASHELVTNIIRHAGLDPLKNKISITASLKNSSINYQLLELLFIDQGIEFNPNEAPEPEFNENSSGGFGIHIIEQLMDEVIYQRKNDKNYTYLKSYLGKGVT